MISIIIPVLNEEKNIQKLQEHLSTLDGEFEVIFSDGGSTDRTVELIREPFRLVTGERGRGMQMNRGAEAAKGELLFFIHCDVELEKDVLRKVPEEVKDGKAVGYLRIAFQSDRILMKICGFMSEMRAKFRKIVFADQSFMIRRDLFLRCGKIPELMLMEDYEFSIRLKEMNVPIKRIPGKIKVSARRFEKNGMFLTMWQMQKMQIKYRKNRGAGNFIDQYQDVR